MMSVSMPPAEVPVTNTRSASPPKRRSVYVIMDMSETGSLPPPRMCDSADQESKQLPFLEADG
jgi:hypothetical protein